MINIKLEIQSYKGSIRESSVLSPYLGIVWEFYVTHAICKTAGQRRFPADYNHKQLPLSEMLKVAGISRNNIKVLAANSINKTLASYDLITVEGKSEDKHNVAIEVDTPRIVCLTPYSIADEDPPSPRLSEAECILTHIRNAFAHGNTFLFPNDNILLEDIAQDGKTITARILLHQITLIDWIPIIDKDSRFYHIEEAQEDDHQV